MFKSKLWRMGQALSKLGGTKRLKQLEEWKSSSWSFSIDIKEVNRQLVRKELGEKISWSISDKEYYVICARICFSCT